MKLKKLTLGLAGTLVALAGMTACNEVTKKDGVVLQFTDSTGKVHDYTAKELFEDYLPSSSSASTVFSNVRKVLIRNYFESDEKKEALAAAKKEAENDILGLRDTAKTNAENNGTSYQTEWEKILDSEGVDNIEELYDKKLLEEEEKAFDNEYYTTASYNAIRDGDFWDDLKTAELVEKYGPVSEGYLAERLPYHVSHILVKLAAGGSNEYTQDTLSEAEARKLSAVVKEIAGAHNDETGTPLTSAETRLRFGTIAQNLSDDDTSAANYGDLGIMDKNTSFVQEFKLGLYAYEALYNQQTKSEAGAADLLPSGEGSLIDATEAASIKTSFENRGIGTIPYGAFVALGYDEVANDPDLGYRVNENSSLFYARNVLLNKYMNNHQIAVITPNYIPYNAYYEPAVFTTDAAWTGNDYNAVYAIESPTGDAETGGTLTNVYSSLPGFSVDTTSILPGIGSNVLTNEKGQVVLAVRAGASSYQGIHFIVVDRSALVEYAAYNETTGAYEEITESDYTTKKGSADVNSLSEYYTMEVPKNIPSTDAAAASEDAEDLYYPFYKDSTGAYKAKSTFVNKLVAGVADYDAQANKVTEAVKAVVSDDNTYIFEELIVNGSIKFNTSGTMGAKLEELVNSYIKTTRESSYISGKESFDKDWKTYAEYLDQMDAARKMKADGSQKLISEVCAIGYGSSDAKNGEGLWAKGGACYDGK
ncbi:MAG: peptidyl-prolyl cis-trans isomerase [Bacilli bacterium]|nr:peptidyl-prolyl cis-trans isomerase [Bacilli bacterium]